MEHFLDISKYTIYKIMTDEDLLVALSNDYTKQVDGFIKEYGSIEKVPSSKTVRGIFIKSPKNNNLEMVSSPNQENDITVNQLRLLN